MLDNALFASTDVHPRSVVLPDGSTATFHFRELPAIELRRQHLAETSEDVAVRDGAIARLISVGLCDADGRPAITAEDAARLKPAVAGQFVSHIMEVSGFGVPKEDAELGNG